MAGFGDNNSILGLGGLGQSYDTRLYMPQNPQANESLLPFVQGAIGPIYPSIPSSLAPYGGVFTTPSRYANGMTAAADSYGFGGYNNGLAQGVGTQSTGLFGSLYPPIWSDPDSALQGGLGFNPEYNGYLNGLFPAGTGTGQWNGQAPYQARVSQPTGISPLLYPVNQPNSVDPDANWQRLRETTRFYDHPQGYHGPQPPVPPMPAGVNLDNNIYDAQSYAYGPQLIKDIWFYETVKPNGPWDYKDNPPSNLMPLKRQDWYSTYDPFGNFLYGAGGSAAGYPDANLYKGAGFADRLKYNNPKTRANSYQMHPQWGTPPSRMGWNLKWTGGTGPNYGDDQTGHQIITDGINYYRYWWQPHHDPMTSVTTCNGAVVFDQSLLGW